MVVLACLKMRATARDLGCVSWPIAPTWSARHLTSSVCLNPARAPPANFLPPALQLPKLMAQKIKILLVDDHPLVREWLTNLINQRPDFQVCGETGNAPEALQLIESIKPDIAIVDISLASGSGIELVKSIK